MSTLYLIPAERKAYDALPAVVRKAWNGSVEKETGTAWESDEQLQERAMLLGKNTSPKMAVALGKMMEKLQKKGIDAISEKDIPRDAFPQMMAVLGAVGLTAAIYEAIAHAATPDDLDAAMALSGFRHEILLFNASSLRK